MELDNISKQTKMTDSYSFNQIFELVDAYLKSSGLSLPEMYHQLGRPLCDWYSLGAFTKDFDGFRLGDRRDDVMSAYVATKILSVVCPSILPSPVPQMWLNELMETLAVHMKVSGKSIEWCYQYLSEEAAGEYPLSQATSHTKKYKESGHVAGQVSMETAKSILSVFEKWMVYDPPQKDTPEKLRTILSKEAMPPRIAPEKPSEHVIQKSYMTYGDLHQLIQKWTQAKRVGFENIIPFLPDVHQVAAKGYVSFQAGKRQYPPEFSFEMVTDIRRLYDSMQHIDCPASPEDIECDNKFDCKIILQMSSRVASAQIAAAKKLYKYSPKRLISELVAAGFNERSAMLLLGDDKKGELVSRRLVGAVLSKMGVAPEQGVSQFSQKLDLPDHLIDIQTLHEKLDKLFNDVGGVSTAVAYNMMPTTYRKSIDFNEVAGWWDGRVDIAQKDKFGMYVSAAIAAIEASPLPA